jgi:hypothetical protein
VNLVRLRVEDLAEGMNAMECWKHNLMENSGGGEEWEHVEEDEDEDVVKVPLRYLGPEA